MKERRFKVGDKVTYKSRSECGGSYFHSGTDQGGYVGKVTREGSWNPSKNCYEIYATCREGEVYIMLELEFKEYNSSPTLTLKPRTKKRPKMSASPIPKSV